MKNLVSDWGRAPRAIPRGAQGEEQQVSLQESLDFCSILKVNFLGPLAKLWEAERFLECFLGKTSGSHQGIWAGRFFFELYSFYKHYLNNCVLGAGIWGEPHPVSILGVKLGQ